MSKGLMKENHQLKSKVIPLLLIVLLLPSFITYSVAGSSLFAPSWLKNGLYATYASDSGSIYFYNETSSLGFDSVRFTDAVFRWECLDLNETMVKLRFSLDYTEIERNGRTLEEKQTTNLVTEIFVDILSRAVYLQNGTLIGTTRLWLPANPTPNDDILMWDVPPDRVTIRISEGTTYVLTPQGSQKAFKISSMANGTIDGMPVSFHGLWDLDTGIMVQEFSQYPEPAFSALGLREWTPSVVIFQETNIDLGPSDAPLDLRTIFAIIALPVAAVIIFIAVYSKQRRKKVRKKRNVR
jgi:hypothetical protein